MHARLVLVATPFLLWINHNALGEEPGIPQAGRIVGGQVVEPHKYPSMVKLEVLGRHACGATILNREWVLTAAHCVSFHVSVPLKDYRAIVGAHNISTPSVGQQNLSLVKVVVNDHYDLPPNASIRMDLAVIQVRPMIRFSNTVVPANLPTCRSEPKIGRAWGVGWGFVSPWGNFSDTLKEVETSIMPNDKCRELVPPVYKPAVNSKKICADDKMGNGICSGDSGGPLYILEGDTQYQVGVVSGGTQGPNCGHAIALYARVSHYAGWIHRRIIGCGNYFLTPRRNIEIGL